MAAPHDGIDLARQIEWILNNPKKAKHIRHQALETAEHYNWPTINGRLISHYETLIQNQKGQKVELAFSTPPVKKRRKSPVAPAKSL